MAWWDKRVNSLLNDNGSTTPSEDAWWSKRYNAAVEDAKYKVEQLKNNPPEKPKIETPAPEPKKDRSIFSRIGEFGENVIAGAKTIPATLKGALGLAPEAATSGEDISSLKVENHLKSLKYSLQLSEKDLANIDNNRSSTGFLDKFAEKLAKDTGSYVPPQERRAAIVKSIENTKQEIARLEGVVAEKEKNPDLFRKIREQSVTEYKQISESNDKYLIEKYGSPDKWSGQWLANEVGSNVPQFLASFGVSLATGLVTKNPRLALAVGFNTSFVQEAGGAYQEARAAGVADFDAQRIASNTGMANALIEQIPLGRALGKMDKGSQIKKNVLKRVTDYLTEKALDGTYEGTTESMQQIVQNAFSSEYKENKSLFEGVPESFVVGGALGLFGGVSEDVYMKSNKVPVINAEAVTTANKIITDAIATPKEKRTPTQQEFVDSMVDEPNISEGRATKKSADTSVEMSLYRGEGSDLQGVVKESGAGAMFGEGKYYATSEEEAAKYGKVVKEKISLKPSEVLNIENQDKLQEYVNKALELFPNETNPENAISKLAKQEGYKAIFGFDTVNILDSNSDSSPNTKKESITVNDRIEKLITREKESIKSIDEESRAKGEKAIGMQYAAIKRAVEGNPTQNEIRNARIYLNSIHSGKELTLNGEKVVATGKVSFGKHQVTLNYGTKKYVEKSELVSEKVTSQDVLNHIKKEAENKLTEREKLFFREEETKTEEKPAAKETKTPVKTLPSESTPVGGGAVKESAFLARMKEELLESDPSKYEFDENSGKYNALNLEEDAKKAVKFLEENPEKAIAVGLGLIDPPKGQTANAVAMVAALKAKEEGNYGLYGDLVTSTSLRATRMGQEIVSLRGQFNLNSAESFIKRVVDARMEKLGKTLVSDAESGGRKLSNKERAIKHIDSKVKKAKEILTADRAKIKLAQDIIDAMRC